MKNIAELETKINNFNKSGIIIYSAMPCLGKSYGAEMINKNKGYVKVLDLESSDYRWIDKVNKIENPNFLEDYLKAILEAPEKYSKLTHILVASHKMTRDMLDKVGLNYTVVVPKLSAKAKIINSCRDRGNDEAFIKMYEENYEKWINEINESNYHLIELDENEYIYDLVKDKTIENINTFMSSEKFRETVENLESVRKHIPKEYSYLTAEELCSKLNTTDIFKMCEYFNIKLVKDNSSDGKSDLVNGEIVITYSMDLQIYKQFSAVIHLFNNGKLFHYDNSMDNNIDEFYLEKLMKFETELINVCIPYITPQIEYDDETLKILELLDENGGIYDEIKK